MTISRKTLFTEPMGEAGTRVKNGIHAIMGDNHRLEREITRLIRQTTGDTLRGVESMTDETFGITRDILMGAMTAAEEIGIGISSTTRMAAKGIVLGLHDVGGDIVAAANHTVKISVQNAWEIGVDGIMVARASADGVLEATCEVKGNVAEVTKAIIQVAIESFGTIGNRAS